MDGDIIRIHPENEPVKNEQRVLFDLNMKMLSDGTIVFKMDGSMKMEELMKISMSSMGLTNLFE